MDCLWHNDLMHDLFFPLLGDARFMILHGFPFLLIGTVAPVHM